MSQDALAEKAGINAETISRIENGLTTTTKTLRKLAAVLPDLSRFIGGNDAATTSTSASAHQEPTGHRSMESEDLKALIASVCALVQGLTTNAALLSARGHLITLLREEQHTFDAQQAEKPTLVHSTGTGKGFNHRPRRQAAG